MTSRSLKIALAASVALNLFAAAAAATLLVGRGEVAARVEAQQRPGRAGSPMDLTARLSPEAQPAVREALRAAALGAKPDFDEARAKRREAVALAAAPAFEPARVTALLDQSRAAELRGRKRLEAGAIAMLAGLSPADRAVMSDILSRKRGRDRDRDRDGDRDRDRGAEAAPTRPQA